MVGLLVCTVTQGRTRTHHHISTARLINKLNNNDGCPIGMFLKNLEKRPPYVTHEPYTLLRSWNMTKYIQARAKPTLQHTFNVIWCSILIIELHININNLFIQNKQLAFKMRLSNWQESSVQRRENLNKFIHGIKLRQIYFLTILVKYKIRVGGGLNHILGEIC